MDPSNFVNVLKKVVSEQSARNTIENLDNPPGRNPSIELIEVSEFYKGLSENQKLLLYKVINMVAEDTLFGVLCVLDGVRAIESGEDKGELELTYKKGNLNVLLNDPKDDFLHDLM